MPLQSDFHETLEVNTVKDFIKLDHCYTLSLTFTDRLDCHHLGQHGDKSSCYYSSLCLEEQKTKFHNLLDDDNCFLHSSCPPTLLNQIHTKSNSPDICTDVQRIREQIITIDDFELFIGDDVSMEETLDYGDPETPEQSSHPVVKCQVSRSATHEECSEFKSNQDAAQSQIKADAMLLAEKTDPSLSESTWFCGGVITSLANKIRDNADLLGLSTDEETIAPSCDLEHDLIAHDVRSIVCELVDRCIPENVMITDSESCQFQDDEIKASGSADCFLDQDPAEIKFNHATRVAPAVENMSAADTVMSIVAKIIDNLLAIVTARSEQMTVSNIQVDVAGQNLKRFQDLDLHGSRQQDLSSSEALDVHGCEEQDLRGSEDLDLKRMGADLTPYRSEDQDPLRSEQQNPNMCEEQAVNLSEEQEVDQSQEQVNGPEGQVINIPEQQNPNMPERETVNISKEQELNEEEVKRPEEQTINLQQHSNISDEQEVNLSKEPELNVSEEQEVNRSEELEVNIFEVNRPEEQEFNISKEQEDNISQEPKVNISEEQEVNMPEEFSIPREQDVSISEDQEVNISEVNRPEEPEVNVSKGQDLNRFEEVNSFEEENLSRSEEQVNTSEKQEINISEEQKVNISEEQEVNISEEQEVNISEEQQQSGLNGPEEQELKKVERKDHSRTDDQDVNQFKEQEKHVPEASEMFTVKRSAEYPGDISVPCKRAKHEDLSHGQSPAHTEGSTLMNKKDQAVPALEDVGMLDEITGCSPDESLYLWEQQQKQPQVKAHCSVEDEGPLSQQMLGEDKPSQCDQSCESTVRKNLLPQQQQHQRAFSHWNYYPCLQSQTAEPEVIDTDSRPDGAQSDEGDLLQTEPGLSGSQKPLRLGLSRRQRVTSLHPQLYQ